MNELNKELREQAIHLGLCKQWQGLWNEDWSPDKLAERMYAGIDFCLKYHYPSNDYISKHFEKKFLRSKNIFLDDKRSVTNPKQSLIIGDSDIIVRFNADKNGFIHVRDNSVANVCAKNRSFVIVHLYDHAQVNAEQFDSAKIVIVKHSRKVTVVAEEKIKVREEYDYLK